MSRLKPRQGSYEDALDAFCSGDSSFCLELLSNDHSAQAFLLSSRACMRLGLPDDAFDRIESLALQDLTHELAAEALALKILALTAQKRFHEATAASVEARARCFSSGNVAIEGELLFLAALGSMIQGDLAVAEKISLEIFELENCGLQWVQRSSYRFSLDFWRFRACDLLGAIEHSRGNRASQALWFERAFVEFDKAGIRDDFLEASLVANYADSAIDAGSSRIIDFVVDRAKRIAWTPTLAGLEFRVFSALAEASSMAGDQLSALRYFRRCSNCAPSAPLQIKASVERARIFSEIGEAYSSREELDHAVRLSKSVDWKSVEATEQNQLLFLAAQVAAYCAADAKRLLCLYDGLKVSTIGGVVTKSDRLRGEEFFARALVLRSIGSLDRANLAFIEAFDVWTAAGLDSMAAVASAELSKSSAFSDFQRETQSELFVSSKTSNSISLVRND